MKFLLVLYAILNIAKAELPSYIKVCRRSDPQIAECIINSVYSLKPKLAKGIPELKVPSMEPLPLDEIKLRTGPNSAKINANITNILVWGPSAFEILSLTLDIPKNSFVFKIKLPHIFFKGDYDIDMNVLILKYKGQGPITGNFTDLTADVVLQGHISNINGNNHIQFKKVGLNLSIYHSYLHLGNLFANQQNLGRATNEVVNDNSDIFINEIKPALTSSLADKFTAAANGICKTFTYEELFPN